MTNLDSVLKSKGMVVLFISNFRDREGQLRERCRDLLRFPQGSCLVSRG